MKLILRKLKLKTLIFPIFLGLVSLAVIFANFTPETFFTGWDTLHPEFNFPLAFERSFNGVWRADQGLGTIAIQSHMADLIRTVILFFLSLAFPLNSLRYITMLSPLLIGPLGAYFLISYLLGKNKFTNPIAFLGALSYLCNLAVVQQFVVGLEMFTWHFAFLPWALLFGLKYIKTPAKKMLLLFTFTTILLITQAHTATLFYVYFASITVTFLSLALSVRSFDALKRTGILLFMVLIINSYWLLPNLYAVASQANEIQQSRIDRFFSPEAFAKNQIYGNPKDASLAKNFLFDWKLYDFKKNGSVDVVAPWILHLKNPLVTFFGYGVFAVAIIGILHSLFKKDKTFLVLFPIAVISYLFLLNGTYPVTLFFDNLSNISPTLKEALRFPFTKFSIIYVLFLSVFFARGLTTLLNLLKQSIIKYIAIIVIAAGFGYYFYPAFTGSLVSPAVRINIPQEYFSMFEWFNSRNHSDRVAVLPIHSFWGWTYNSWGYQGAGFLQFGIPQPLLDRDYDRWSKYNEQYQREMQYAIYNQKSDLLEKVLKKYAVRWIILDKSVVNLGGYQNETLSWYIPKILENSPYIHLVQNFGKDLLVYEVNESKSFKSQIFTNLPESGPAMIGSSLDRIYQQEGTYIVSNSAITDREAGLYTFDERFNGDTEGNISYVFNGYSAPSQIAPCSDEKIQAQRSTKNGIITYKSTNGILCDHYNLSELSHDKSYIVKIISKNIQGFPLQVYLCNNLTLHCNQTVYLHKKDSFQTEKFIIPSYNDYGTGYTINISNFSIKNQTSINAIEKIIVKEYNPTALQTQTPGALNQNAKTIAAVPGKTEVSFTSTPNKNQTLAFYERYDKGWKAYVMEDRSQESGVKGWLTQALPFIFRKELKNHVKINNWANGWKLDDSTMKQFNNQTILIVYLPQYLEYFGIIIGLMTLLGLTGYYLAVTINGNNAYFEKKTETLKRKIQLKLSILNT